MEVPQPQTEPMLCPECGVAARFVLPYQMLFLDPAGADELDAALRQHPHRLRLERRADRQVLWYFPDLYGGPWEGWEGRYGVCVCPSCGLRRKHDRLAPKARRTRRYT